MTPTLLVVGGGALALPALRWSREAGFDPVLVHPDARTPLRRFACEVHAVPETADDAIAALARRLARSRELAGILVTEAARLGLLATLADAAPQCLPPRKVLELLRRPDEMRVGLRARGLPVANLETGTLDVFAFFRDGAFVPGGIAERTRLDDGARASVQPAELAPERENAVYVLVERAARALGLERGLLQASLVDGAGVGELALVTLVPGFADPIGSTYVARHVHGRSPLQAWFAHLAGAGGPFDELALGRSACAGWLALEEERTGLFGGLEGLGRARAIPGFLGAWSEDPGRELDPAHATAPLGYLWAEGHDREELLERLRAARAALEVRVACRPLVA